MSTSTSRSEFVADRFFEAAGDLVRGAERERAVDFEIERHRQAAFARACDRMGGDVMHRQRAVAGDHHHALHHALVVERARFGGHRDFRAAGCRRHRADDALLERRHPVERQGAADRDDEVDEQHAAGLPHPQPVDVDDAGNAEHARGDAVRGARRCGIGERLDGPPPQPPAGDADEHRHDDRGDEVGPG